MLTLTSNSILTYRASKFIDIIQQLLMGDPLCADIPVKRYVH